MKPGLSQLIDECSAYAEGGACMATTENCDDDKDAMAPADSFSRLDQE